MPADDARGASWTRVLLFVVVCVVIALALMALTVNW